MVVFISLILIQLHPFELYWDASCFEMACILHSTWCVLIPLQGWRWRQQGAPKHLYPTTSLHGVTIQKNAT